GHGRILIGREYLVRDEVIVVDGNAQFVLTTKKVFIVPGPGPTTIVIVKFKVVGKKTFEPYHLLPVVLDQVFKGPAGPFAFYVEELVVIDELAVEMGLHVLEKLDFILWGSKILIDHFLSEPPQIPGHQASPGLRFKENVPLAILQLIQLILKIR